MAVEFGAGGTHETKWGRELADNFRHYGCDQAAPSASLESRYCTAACVWFYCLQAKHAAGLPPLRSPGTCENLRRFDFYTEHYRQLPGNLKMYLKQFAVVLAGTLYKDSSLSFSLAFLLSC